MTFIVATNVIASRPPEYRPTGTPHARANFKLTKYSRWKSSGWLVYDLGRMELTVIAGQFGLLCRAAYKSK